MEIHYKSANGRYQVKLEGATVKELVQKVAEFQEIFEEDTCGNCGEDNTRFGYRVVDDNDYYEVVCKKCGHKLGLGQKKDKKNLFPKRTDKDGKTLPKGGWHKWTPSDYEEDVFEEKPSKSPAKGGRK